MIKAAGHYCAVYKYAEMVAKAVAEYSLTKVIARDVGPIEAVAVFEVQAVMYSRPTLAERPFIREPFLHNSEGVNIPALVVASVP